MTLALRYPAVHRMKRKFWLISDTHFFHKKILTYTGKDGSRIRSDFSSLEEMHAVMLERWNATVKTGHRVYHLGDVFMEDLSGFKTLFPKFTGQKSLITGNHDDQKTILQGGWFRKSEVIRKFPEYGLYFSHIPQHESSLTWKGNVLLNVHGHIHEKPSPPGPYHNVSVERINYTPVDLEEVIELRDQMLGTIVRPSLSAAEE